MTKRKESNWKKNERLKRRGRLKRKERRRVTEVRGGTRCTVEKKRRSHDKEDRY